MIRVAINGFGRIGRNAFKVALQRKEKIEFVAVNDLAQPEDLAYLLKYDTVHGVFDKEISFGKDFIQVGKHKIKTYSTKDPKELPWKKLKVDIVLECTGVFRTRESAQGHIDAGAKSVIISAPSKSDDVFTCLMGVNDKDLPHDDGIFDSASCTTNSVAPVVDIIQSAFGVKKASMTTIHAYTADQRLVDSPHRDRRRGRSAAENIIPTSTGAATATTRAIPELRGKFDGMAVRVPVVCGSLTDFTFVTEKETSKEEVNAAFKKAASSKQYKKIVMASEEELVSSDIIGTSYSVIVDLPMTNVIDGDLVKVLGWYDNEWGYSHRLVDGLLARAKQL